MKNASVILLSLLVVFLSFTTHASSVTKQLEIQHSEFEVPLVFNVVLPSGYQQETSRS